MNHCLRPPDTHHLQAAQGWLELGNHLEANQELERITAQLRSHPEVLEVRWHIHAHAKKWDACVDIADAIIKLAPGRLVAPDQENIDECCACLLIGDSPGKTTCNSK
jgi:hypothetical protein